MLAHALVDAHAEGQMSGRVAGEVELVGVSQRRGSRFAAAKHSMTLLASGIVLPPMVTSLNFKASRWHLAVAHSVYSAALHLPCSTSSLSGPNALKVWSA